MSPRGTAPGRLDYVDSVRAVAILMVVAIHALGYVDIARAPRAVISFATSTIAVPVFFLCDGFLAAQRFGSRELDYRQHLVGSARRLLLPWALFSLFYAAARFASESLGVVPQVLVAGQSPGTVIANVYASVIAPQMYFLLSLFLIRLATPVIMKLAASPRLCAAILVLYAFAYLLVEPALAGFFSYGLDPVLHGFWGLQFYLLGTLLAAATNQIEAWGGFIGPVFVASSFAARFLAPSSPLTDTLVQYGYLVGAFAFFAGLGKRQWILPSIGQETMGIYLLHAPVVLKLLDVAVDRLPVSPAAQFALVTAGAFSISLAVSKVLSRIPHGRMLFGELGTKTRTGARAHRV